MCAYQASRPAWRPVIHHQMPRECWLAEPLCLYTPELGCFPGLNCRSYPSVTWLPCSLVAMPVLQVRILPVKGKESQVCGRNQVRRLKYQIHVFPAITRTPENPEGHPHRWPSALPPHPSGVGWDELWQSIPQPLPQGKLHQSHWNARQHLFKWPSVSLSQVCVLQVWPLLGSGM